MLHDALTTGVPVPTVVDDDWIEFPEMTSAMLPGTGIRVQLDVPEFEQVAELADQVQEWIIEELWGAAPTNWPPCPTHPTTHPLVARAYAGVAVWCCPEDGEPAARIGQLARRE